MRRRNGTGKCRGGRDAAEKLPRRLEFCRETALLCVAAERGADWMAGAGQNARPSCRGAPQAEVPPAIRMGLEPRKFALAPCGTSAAVTAVRHGPIDFSMAFVYDYHVLLNRFLTKK